MNTFNECDISDWVDQAGDSSNREFREAVHTILAAIASDVNLRASMILKGGILLAVRYQSHRYTTDIDLSTPESLGDGITVDIVVDALNQSLALMVETLDYDLDCVVQSANLEPNNIAEPTYPSIQLSIGYAYKGSPKHKRLQRHQSPTALSIDYSLNEPTPNIDAVHLGLDGGLLVYSLIDLIAEKYRALLQQASRNRARRQDVFDLYLILERCDEIDEIEKNKILRSLIEKSRARGIEPTQISLEDEELRARAEREYHTLEHEIEGDLPDFDHSYDEVARFYQSLPWHLNPYTSS